MWKWRIEAKCPTDLTVKRVLLPSPGQVETCYETNSKTHGNPS